VPELPEVETVVRTIAPFLVGRRILNAEFSSRHVVRQDFDSLAAALGGRTVRAVWRRGKFIVVELDQGSLTIHLGMTGKLLAGAEPGPYARAVFILDRGVLVYDDVRHFGRIEWSATLPDRVAALGPDALTVSLADFRALLAGRTGRIKPLLLSQNFLSGLGNIYVDETLFASRIHPLAMASRLRKERVEALHQEMQRILTEAIARGGSSISDYVDADGRAGSFQLLHKAYGRKGEPCVQCGGPIRRIVVGQRGTHYCPRCQKR
jgi:formamidopyrimidine-DNA glycosylase